MPGMVIVCKLTGTLHPEAIPRIERQPFLHDLQPHQTRQNPKGAHLTDAERVRDIFGTVYDLDRGPVTAVDLSQGVHDPLPFAADPFILLREVKVHLLSVFA
jgi:hypothetical protein